MRQLRVHGLLHARLRKCQSRYCPYKCARHCMPTHAPQRGLARLTHGSRGSEGCAESPYESCVDEASHAAWLDMRLRGAGDSGTCRCYKRDPLPRSPVSSRSTHLSGLFHESFAHECCERARICASARASRPRTPTAATRLPGLKASRSASMGMKSSAPADGRGALWGIGCQPSEAESCSPTATHGSSMLLGPSVGSGDLRLLIAALSGWC